MGIAWDNPCRRDLSGTLHQNRYVGYCFGVEGGSVFSECGPMRTDTLLFYGTVFSCPGRRDSVARIPDRLAWGIWLVMAGPYDRGGWWGGMVCHGKSLG